MEYTTVKARGYEFEALMDGPEDGELIVLLDGLSLRLDQLQKD